MDAVPTVFVVDDDAAIRDALCFLFRSAGLHAEPFASAQDFLDGMPTARTGCLVSDVRMPGLGGLDLQRHLADRGIGLPVILLTAFGDVRTAVRAMKAGAFDFVEKPFSQDLLNTVRQALQAGQSGASRNEMAAKVRERLGTLTGRERQVLDLVLEGEPNKRIAHTLGISAKTVEYHRANVIAKMGARSTADLIRSVAADRLGQAPG